jgi:hypothetical protein
MDIGQKKIEHKAAWDAGDFNAAAAICAEVRGHVEETQPWKTVRQSGDGALMIGAWQQVPNAADKVFVVEG